MHIIKALSYNDLQSSIFKNTKTFMKKSKTIFNQKPFGGQLAECRANWRLAILGQLEAGQ